MRLFELHRDHDVSGVSGTGRVAQGCEFDDGTTVVRWLVAGTTRPNVVHPTTVVHPNVDNVLALHGHDGATRVVWVDADHEPAAVKAARHRAAS